MSRPAVILLVFASVSAATPTSASSLDRSAIRRAIQHRANELRGCYEAAMDVGGPHVVGRLVVRFTIGEDGMVTHASIFENETGSDRLGQCVTHVVRTTWFGAQPPGRSATLTYPFMFRNP